MMNHFLGLYTGAACDGIDAAIVSLEKVGDDMDAKVIAADSMLMPDSTRRELLAIAGGKQIPADHIAKMSRDLANSAAAMGRKLIADAGVKAENFAACGWSGFETGRRESHVLELTDQALLASKLSMPVVSGFVASDLAAGGKGCAISAWCDWQRFRDKRLTRAVLNLGGLAELVFIPADAQPSDVLAGHIGPGTCIIDDLTFRYQHRIFDNDGTLAASGKVVPELLNLLQARPFFHEEFPRSTSLYEFSPVYLFQVVQEAQKFDCSGADLIATMTELMAWSVEKAVESLTERPHEVILCGGGALNIHLAGRIRQRLSPSSTYTVEKYGIPLRAKKAADMAILAAARIQGFKAHLPNASGASRITALGSVTI